MIVHAFFALVGEVLGDVEVGVLCGFDEFSVYFEGECAEVAVVDASSFDYVLLDVLAEAFED